MEYNFYPPRSRIIDVMHLQRRELCRKNMVTKPGLANNGIANFSGGNGFENCGSR